MPSDIKKRKMNRLKIAVQKSGRLNEDSLKLLKDCGIKVDNGYDQLRVEAANFPVEVLFLRNSDIPQYLEDGVCDLAIIGENLVIEKQKKSEVVEKLGFSKCRVSLAIPKNEEWTGPGYFNGTRSRWTSAPISWPISLTDEERPPAPQSVMHENRPRSRAWMIVSSIFFSVIALPICTA